MMSFVGLLRSNSKHIRSSSIFRKFLSSSTSDEQSKQYEEDIKNKILAASLPFVPELGWSKESVTAGAQSVGYPGVVHGLFLRGGADLVHYFQTSTNTKLVDILKQYQKEFEKEPISPAEFAEKAIQQKLLMIAPYKKRWPQAVAIMSLPPNVPNALAALLTLVDDICYYAGDRSVDFTWYMRRIGIAGVYKASELYLIQDSSEGHTETFKFLNRRMSEAVQIHEILCQSNVTSSNTKDTVTSAFVTARNILGLSWNR